MASNSNFISILSTRAQKELTEAWEWYEERQQSLGDRFVKEIINKIHLIEQNPESIQAAINLTKKHLFQFFHSLLSIN